MLNLKKLFYFALTLAVLAYGSIAHATDSASDTLSGYLKNMRTMKADFVQNIVDKKGKSMQKSTGHMSLLRPNHFRWDVVQPNKQLIVTNGKRLWIYDPDLDQVTIRALAKAAGETPAMLLSSDNVSLTKEFKVSSVQGSPSSLQWFMLIPTDQGTMIASLKLGFANQQIRRMQLQDHLGHTTSIEFNSVAINKNVSSSLFNFKPPAKVDVIDETKR